MKDWQFSLIMFLLCHIAMLLTCSQPKQEFATKGLGFVFGVAAIGFLAWALFLGFRAMP